MNPDDIRLSASSVKGFDKCPLSFYYDQIADTRGLKGDNEFTRRGKVVHETLETSLEDCPEIVEWPKKEIRDYLHAELHEQKVDDCKFEECEEQLEKAATFLSLQDDNLNIKGLEDWFETNIGGLNFCGKIDVCTQSEIWDWKTGNPDDQIEKERIQASTYIHGFEEIYGYQPDRVKFIYLQGKQRKHETDPELLMEIKEKVDPIKKAMERNYFEGMSGDHCYWCEYRIACSENETGIGGEAYDKF